MNREEAATLWPIIKAFAEGFDVQLLSDDDGEWKNAPGPSFHPVYEWRIKPAKAEFDGWVCIKDHSGWSEGEFRRTRPPSSVINLWRPFNITVEV